jgi:hypothetical protein
MRVPGVDERDTSLRVMCSGLWKSNSRAIEKAAQLLLAQQARDRTVAYAAACSAVLNMPGALAASR